MSKTSKTWEKTVEHTHEDKDGNITRDITKETGKMSINDEPDFIKLYTKMWLEFNAIPAKYRQLFFSLVCRMSYARTSSIEKSQIVVVQKPMTDSILEECGWTTRDPLTKGLKALCDAGAIRKIAKACYQINPSYAGRGEWKYNPRLDRGGVKDLIATFSFADGNVNTNIIYADDGGSDEEAEFDRKCYGVSKKDEAVITSTRTRQKKESKKEKPA